MLWAPAGGPPVRYALVWSRPAPGGGLGTCQEEIVPAWEVELPPGTSAPWMAAPPPAAGARQAETGGDFLAGRRADLDPGEVGGALTDAGYDDRTSAWTEAGRRCPGCGGRGWKRTPDSEDYDCRTCKGEGYVP